MTATEEIQVDYSQPLGTLLKLATSVAHDQAQHSQGAGWLTRAELDKEEYVRFLMMLYHIYDTLESGLEKYSSHPVLAPTYNPTLLARAPALASDIAFLLDVPETTWHEHPLNRSLQTSPPEAYKAYVSRLQYLSDDSPDPSPLLAHAYVRYLGDLSGGQTMRRNIARAYALDQTGEGRGTQFYQFQQLGRSNKSASIGDMGKIKEWFRDGMNRGGGDDAARKQVIAEEAIYAFDLNGGLFTLLRAPSNLKSASQAPAKAPLGNPSTPPPTEKYSPLQLSTSSPAEKEKAYSMSTILTVLLAVGLAHFVLVVGGFTGARGFSKLETVQERVAAYFGLG